MSLEPAEGVWEKGVFRFPIRVFYEDTDMGGMVYHGRYISFFERVRTESIRGTAADVDALLANPEENGGPLVYVVSKIAVQYHNQAKIGDILIGHSRVTKVRAAAIEAHQWITRNGDYVAEAHVLVAVVGQDGRPKRWPAAARADWESWLAAAEG